MRSSGSVGLLQTRGVARAQHTALGEGVAQPRVGDHLCLLTGSTGALAISDQRPVTEEDPHNWNDGGACIQCRLAAEDLVLRAGF